MTLADIYHFSEQLLFYLPIGIIGLWRWSVWTLRKILSLRYRVPKGKHSGTFSIITPVYNEDPVMFRRALDSWASNRPDEIIAVIDYTDSKCIEVFDDFRNTFPGAKPIITKKPGKREALADGVRAAQGEIIALVDSDTIWDSGIKASLMAPFSDPEVGGVGPRQDLLIPNTLARKLFQIRLSERFNVELTYLAAMGNALTCLSGRTAVYRRKAIIGLMDELVSETFLGKKCISGDDKCLTNLVQRDKWKVKYLRDTLVYTPGSSDVGTFVKQLIRWTRNSWRADSKAVFSRWLWRNKFLAFHLLDRFVQPFTLLLGPIYFFVAIFKGHWLAVGVLLFWWLVSRSVKTYPHLRKNPQDIIYLPAYIAFGYFLAVIKIYTLFTIDTQSWITRWDKNRLLQLSFLKSIPPYIATALVIFFMVFAVFESENKIDTSFNSQLKTQAVSQTRAKNKIEKSASVQPLDDLEFEKEKVSLLEKSQSDAFGYYKIKTGDNLSGIRERYNIPSEIFFLQEDKTPLTRASVGQMIAIPIAGLRNPLDKDALVSSGRPAADFDAETNTIRISGKGSVVTLATIQRLLRNKGLIERKENKEWTLRANLYIDDLVTLVLDDEEVSWLKLKSEPNNFIWLKSEYGNLVISDTKITSWDEQADSYDTNLDDGRSYLLQKENGRMDIANSELAYLGHLGSPKRGHPFGGTYGVSWKISNGSFRDNLTTGSIRNSKIHHNCFGLYTYGATGMVITNNEFFENTYYGIDPHDDSNNLLIEKNVARNNGTHGIITSKNCFQNIIRDNDSYDNKLHGIMLDKNSTNTLVKKNRVYGNKDGIVLYDSKENIILENEVRDNTGSAIRSNGGSTSNLVENNRIFGNKKAGYFYGNASQNYWGNNAIMENATRLDLKEGAELFTRASGNLFLKKTLRKIEWIEK